MKIRTKGNQKLIEKKLLLLLYEICDNLSVNKAIIWEIVKFVSVLNEF